MLTGISPLISPELLMTLAKMGHGDELVLADAHYPGESTNANVIRADGLSVTDLLDAILPLFELDSYVDDPAVMMSPVPGDTPDPMVEKAYTSSLKQGSSVFSKVSFIERMAFYQRTQSAFAIVMTGETRKYGNIIIKKGVTPVT